MKHLSLAALIAWAALIFIASSIPNPPDAGGGSWKYDAAHVMEYLVFGALAVFALKDRLGWRSSAAVGLAAWALSVAYGMSDEFHQSFVPNRDASWADFALDAFGAAIGTVVTSRLIIQRRRKSQDPQ